MKEVEKLFKYKGIDILIKKVNINLFKIGIRGENNLTIWLNSKYKSVKIAKKSGREYARIIINKTILSKKESKLE